MQLVYKNTEATVQVIDFIQFFDAQNSVNVFNLTIHATSKPFDEKLPTKLSTVNVHECLGHNELKLAFWSVDLLSIIQAAGWPIWPLLLFSVVALALVIERLMSLRVHLVAPAGLLEQAITASQHGLPSNEVVEQLSQHSFLGRVLASGWQALKADAHRPVREKDRFAWIELDQGQLQKAFPFWALIDIKRVQKNSFARHHGLNSHRSGPARAGLREVRRKNQ